MTTPTAFQMMIAERILSEPFPRPGQDMSNSEKWAFVHAVLDDSDDEDLDPETPWTPTLNIFEGLDWQAVYDEWTDEDLFAAVLFADLLNDVYFAIFTQGDGSEADHLNYQTSFVWWKKLKDKHDSDQGHGPFNHKGWLH